MTLLAQRVEAGADEAEMLGARKCAEAAGGLLFDLGHAHGALANVVGKRHGGVADEKQDCISVKARRRSKLAATDCLARPHWPGNWAVSGWRASPSRTRAS